MKDRPAGTLLVILFFVLGGLSLLWGLLVLGMDGISAFFGGGTFGFICGSLWLVIPIAVLGYLLTPGLRKAYKVS